jgi:anhydro-N-acetylmuramic acid kinase
MENKNWYVIGVMSGTSLDGVDLVFAKFTRNKAYSFEILQKEAVEYSEKWKKTLFDGFHLSGEKLTKLNVDYGQFLGELIKSFMQKNGIEKVDFIASHGHTIYHQPDQNYTLQIGSGAVISAITNCKVICDFRVQDVALGGQGAPLVPIGDQLLFGNYRYCLNLGGFANISFQNKTKREAFDICPVNIVMNDYCRKIGLEYDDRGKLAATGNIHQGLLKELNQLPFYVDDKPKSLGYEFIVETVLPMIDAYQLPEKDVLRTFIEHVAFQIAAVIERNTIESDNKNTLFITGGGAFNSFLIERISSYTSCEVIVPDSEIINFKEAIIFAFLGVLKDQNEVNCLKSVTGARKDHSSGVVFHA